MTIQSHVGMSISSECLRRLTQEIVTRVTSGQTRSVRRSATSHWFQTAPWADGRRTLREGRANLRRLAVGVTAANCAMVGDDSECLVRGKSEARSLDRASDFWEPLAER